LPSSVTHSPDRTRPGTPFLTSAIPGLRSALECRNLISSNSFAHRLGTGNSAIRLAPGRPAGPGRPETRARQLLLQKTPSVCSHTVMTVSFERSLSGVEITTEKLHYYCCDPLLLHHYCLHPKSRTDSLLSIHLSPVKPDRQC